MKNSSRDEYFIHWTPALDYPPLSWLLCLPPFYPLLHLLQLLFVLVLLLLYWSHNLTIFVYDLLENLNFIVVIVSLNATLSALFYTSILCTGYLHAYDRIFWCKTFYPCVFTLKILLLWWIFILLILQKLIN